MAEVTGQKVIKKRLRLIRINVVERLQTEMDEAAEDLLQQSRDLAPQLTAEMIRRSGVSRDDEPALFRRSVFYSLPYAVTQHEGFFNPGPVTSTKPGAGRKYLQRPFDAQKRQLLVRLQRELERALRLSLR
jgi:hypothetical protein